MGRTNGSLRIEAVTVEDEGTYKCEASNRGGTVEAQAELDVIGWYKIINVNLSTTVLESVIHVLMSSNPAD